MTFQPVTTLEEAERLVASYSIAWHHRYEIFPGLFTPGVYQPDYVFGLLGLGPEIRGLRVLDVGSSNGFYSRELDRLGAIVTAFDYRTKEVAGFDRMEACYGKQIEHVNANLYDIGALALGEFDIILCLGVLYHVPEMVRALWDLRRICRGTLFLETHVDDFQEDWPAARYYPRDSFLGDITCFWGPNEACVEAMLHDVGFETATKKRWGSRLLVRAAAVKDTALKMPRAYGRVPFDGDLPSARRSKPKSQP
jgi:tRNA (mo5U34)-methyltransferase